MAKANQHLPCPCGTSSDAFSYDKNGWWKCFSCGQNFNEEQLGEGAIKQKYRQRIKPSQKTYSREKQKQLKAEDLQSFHAKNSNT